MKNHLYAAIRILCISTIAQCAYAGSSDDLNNLANGLRGLSNTLNQMGGGAQQQQQNGVQRENAYPKNLPQSNGNPTSPNSNTKNVSKTKSTGQEKLEASERYINQAIAADEKGDFVQAQRLSQMSADMGNSWAMNFIGRNALQGRGEPKNYSKALIWTEKAVQYGNPAAQAQLGYMYQTGIGVNKDLVAAAKLYEKAALQGWAHAQSNLGICYMNGIGVKEDLNKAHYWLEKAAAQGDEQGKETLKFLTPVKQKPREKTSVDICHEKCIDMLNTNEACTGNYSARFCQDRIDSCSYKCEGVIR